MVVADRRAEGNGSLAGRGRDCSTQLNKEPQTAPEQTLQQSANGSRVTGRRKSTAERNGEVGKARPGCIVCHSLQHKRGATRPPVQAKPSARFARPGLVPSAPPPEILQEGMATLLSRLSIRRPRADKIYEKVLDKNRHSHGSHERQRVGKALPVDRVNNHEHCGNVRNEHPRSFEAPPG